MKHHNFRGAVSSQTWPKPYLGRNSNSDITQIIDRAGWWHSCTKCIALKVTE